MEDERDLELKIEVVTGALVPKRGVSPSLSLMLTSALMDSK